MDYATFGLPFGMTDVLNFARNFKGDNTSDIAQKIADAEAGNPENALDWLFNPEDRSMPFTGFERSPLLDFNSAGHENAAPGGDFENMFNQFMDYGANSFTAFGDPSSGYGSPDQGFVIPQSSFDYFNDYSTISPGAGGTGDFFDWQDSTQPDFSGYV